MSALIRSLVTAAACYGVTCGANARANAEEWRFAVSLDGKAIGYHRFTLNGVGSQHELLSEARFNVKFLFVSAYRYVHDTRELWSDGCLKQIAARTNDNGRTQIVSGEQTDRTFHLSAGARSADLDHCIQTFAYWNPDILAATHLLNPQTGEFVPVHIKRIGTETVDVRGVARSTQHYRLIGDSTIAKLTIDLWYSTANEWLALESLTEDGRRLRYRLQ